MQHDGIAGIIENRCAPGLRGLNKGPNMRYGKRGHRIDPERPDTFNDCRIQYQAIEEAGGMRNNPELKFWANRHMRALKSDHDAGIIKSTDLDKEGGHPLLAEPPGYSGGISRDDAVKEAQQIVEAVRNE